MIWRKIKWGVVLCVVLMICYGCSSSGSNSSLSEHSYYKFYVDNNSSTLYAVDPNNPTSPIIVDNITIQGYPLCDTAYSWQYDASTYNFSNAHPSYIIYSKKGSIYKLSTDIKDSLTPVQVSNLNDSICNLWVETENSNPDLDFISVETAGPDGYCSGWCATTYTNYSNDNQYYLVRLDMSSTDSPIPVPKDYIEDYYYDYSTGNVGGIFIDNSGTFEACSSDLTSCTPINATDIEVIGDYPGKVYLSINDTEIYSFDKNSQTLTAIYNLPYYLDDYIQDKDNVYFNTDYTLYKLDTNSDNITSLYTDTDPIDNINITNDKIVYSTYNFTSDLVCIKILDKTGGIPTTIFSFNSTSLPDYKVMTTSDKIVVATDNATLIYDEYGNLLKTFNATIAGLQFSNSGNMINYNWPPTKILINDDITSALSAVSLGDVSVTTIAQSLPTNIIEWESWRNWSINFSLSNTFLITGITNYYDGDIFFFDTSKVDSLTRVTNTPDDEVTLSWW